MSDGKIIRGLTLDLGAPIQDLKGLAAESLGVSKEQIVEVRPRKVSLDARGKHPKKVYTVEVWHGEQKPPTKSPPQLLRPKRMKPFRDGQAPIIVGSGPAGLWAALRCIETGQPVVLLDRGEAVEQRNRDVRALRVDGKLDEASNLCFGEGGAGTYSDGKLYTRINNPLVRRVYRDLVALGAEDDILIEAHPHVGTNFLIRILKRLRAFLEQSGCRVGYGAHVTGLVRNQKGNVCGVTLADGREIIGPAVVLATGHSARDVYAFLQKAGVHMESKAFSIGARVEHPQGLIDEIQFGHHAGHLELGAATYALTARAAERGVYSFCMCPGGFIIPTTTEQGHLNVNGMSNSNRGSRWANSALVVTVEPQDFFLEHSGDLASFGALAGIAFQRHLEREAFLLGGGGFRAPAQRLTDFVSNRLGDLPPATSYKPGITPADLRLVLPKRLTDPLARAIVQFDKKMPGFMTEQAVLIAVETTTSSPIRLLREQHTLAAPDFPGLYPCGEGAGYAGGIVSSALDGIRVADALLSTIG
jgi:uncharacterized FAD-dependent dehydrogenase